MLKKRIYYQIKPYLPWRMRIALRRMVAGRTRAKHADVWPILPEAGLPPAGWRGWPEGKQFSFVLTHDVEGPEGLAKCRQLAELEMEMGFRSSFNFIPEGDYQVTKEFRDWLTANGFEVGIHDLHHDGKLFDSQIEFAAHARKINRYAAEWKASGFRAGFMLRNLDWFHELDVEYDASTFDTDPFEMQSDGLGTIFPRWMPAPESSGQKRKGYMELPYTLVQDSTLFLVLRESTPDIWLRKSDWLVERGGMVLVNVHPDYLRFDGEAPAKRTFDVGHYRSLLAYIRDKYRGQYWHALPREVAAYCRSMPSTPEACIGQATSVKSTIHAVTSSETKPMSKTTNGKIVMLLENSYPGDTRVRNEATLLHSAGYDVTVFCLGKPSQARYEIINGIKVYRAPRVELFKKTIVDSPGFFGRFMLKAKALIGYGFEYGYFTAACFSYCLYIYIRHGLDAIHAHNPPDTPFVVGIPFRLLGKKYVFDHHDLCPELYRSRYNAGEVMQTRILRFVEWGSLKVANATIATNESYKQVQIERGGRAPESIFVVRNGPSDSRMKRGLPSPRLRAMGKKILVYIGSLNPQDGVDYLLRSLNHLKKDLGRTDFYCVIMGAGDSLEDLRALSTELNLNDNVELTGYVSDEDLSANLAAADICMDPDPSSPLNDVSTWIKIMEYMAAAKPIVTFDLKETRYSAQDAAVYVKPNDEMAFAQATASLMDMTPEERAKIGDYGRKRVEDELQWSVVGQNLLKTYAYLLGAPKVVPTQK